MKSLLPPPEVGGLKVPVEHLVQYVRVNTAVDLYGLSRPHLFELIAKGKIESKLIKRDGATRGIRLINAASLRAFIASFGD